MDDDEYYDPDYRPSHPDYSRQPDDMDILETTEVVSSSSNFPSKYACIFIVI